MRLCIDLQDQSRNANWTRVEESKDAKELCGKMCSDDPRSVTSTEDVIWGGVLNVANYAKFHQNQLRGFGSLMG